MLHHRLCCLWLALQRFLEADHTLHLFLLPHFAVPFVCPHSLYLACWDFQLFWYYCVPVPHDVHVSSALPLYTWVDGCCSPMVGTMLSVRAEVLWQFHAQIPVRPGQLDQANFDFLLVNWICFFTCGSSSRSSGKQSCFLVPSVPFSSFRHLSPLRPHITSLS